jgi:AAA+ ATPase superfamily predicted ATPase
MEKQQNPFLLIGYQGEKFFCDRENETELLQNYLLQGQHVTLFAIRRLGKTGLIRHVFSKLEAKKVNCIYVDILTTNNLQDLINQLASEIYRRFPPEKPTSARIWETLKSFRPVLSFDELSGVPELSLTIENPTQQQKTIEQLFSLLDKQQNKCVIALDEFQQILNYPEKNIEAVLRTILQNLKNTTLLFCGSNQSMMHELFNSAKRPFFASCTNMYLGFIEQTIYHQFITQHFNEGQQEIDSEAIDFILYWTYSHTYYTQYFCHFIYAKQSPTVSLQDVKKYALELISLQENTFFQYRNLLPDAQWKLLSAIAKEEKVTQILAGAFIKKHNLNSASSVQRSLSVLLEKELIFHAISDENPYYQVYDKFLLRWIQHTFQNR